uniref:Uncharacterized protein n=1 Tax=Anopheles merus TaxID=30066 RepID=A0A182URM5_ANOME
MKAILFLALVTILVCGSHAAYPGGNTPTYKHMQNGSNGALLTDMLRQRPPPTTTKLPSIPEERGGK